MAVLRLNTPLVLEERQRAPDGMGGFRLSWRPLGMLYGHADAGGGAMRGAQVGPESVVRWKFVLRGFRSGDPRRPVPGQRLRMGTRVFNIHAVYEMDPAGRYLGVTAQEE